MKKIIEFIQMTYEEWLIRQVDKHSSVKFVMHAEWRGEVDHLENYCKQCEEEIEMLRNSLYDHTGNEEWTKRSRDYKFI